MTNTTTETHNTVKLLMNDRSRVVRALYGLQPITQTSRVRSQINLNLKGIATK